MFGYQEDQRYADQYFEKEMVLTAGTAKTGSTALRVGKHLGSIALKVSAVNAYTLAAGKTLTAEILESDTLDGTFTLHTKAASLTITGATGSNVYADRENMMTFVLPDCKTYVKIRLTAGTAGTVDVYMVYLAR